MVLAVCKHAVQMSANPEQGEVTLVVEGAAVRAPTPASDAEVTSALRRLLERGVPGSQAAREVAAELGVPRGRAYDLAVALKHDLVGPGEGVGSGEGADEVGASSKPGEAAGDTTLDNGTLDGRD